MKLRIEKAVYGGAGLARADGKAVFVPMVLPGEEVEVATVRDRGSFAEAEIVRVLEPSLQRGEPPCPYYGACGGCQYQHAAYQAQLGMKQAILSETLARVGLRDLPKVAMHAGEPWGYRNRIRLHVDPVSHALGYRRRGSHAILPVSTCPIAAPLLQQSIAAIAHVCVEQDAGAWCSEVELFTNESSTTLLMALQSRSGTRVERQALARLSAAVSTQVPQLTGAGLFDALAVRGGGRARRPARALTSDTDQENSTVLPAARWGDESLTYEVGAEQYGVSLGSFFQGNRFLVETLASLAIAGENGDLAWDLFAGVGLFAKMLAQRFERVVAVEGAPLSAADLRRNLRNGKAVESSTLAFLKSQSRLAWRPDLVVLDPPRAGLGTEASTLLAAVHSPEITYVSCDPATLARDLRVLVDAGYTISQLDLVDMFPQTFHLETVARLRLR